MDAGVPIKCHVGAIGVGLYVNKSSGELALDDYNLLTDIVGLEDFAGYMDFKMAGSRTGMTAIQLELKINGLPVELFERIFEVSKSARMQVLDVMDKAISEPRKELSPYAPKVEILAIDKEYIGQVIGSGGSTIKEMSEKFSVEINVNEKENKGVVSISSQNIDDIKTPKK